MRGGCTNNSMSFLPLSVLGGEGDLVFKTMRNYKATCILYDLVENYHIVHVLLKRKKKCYCTCTYWVLCQKKKKNSRCNN